MKKYSLVTSLKMAKTTVKDLNLKVSDLKAYFNSELGKFREEIASVKTPTIDEDDEDVRKSELLNKFDFFKATVEGRLKDLESQVSALNKDANALHIRLDNETQRSNKGKILLFGLDENTNENLQKEVIGVIGDKLKLSIKDSDIYDCYRYGKKRDKKNRPVLIQFTTVCIRNEVFYGKRALKGSKIVITEVLSPSRYEVYRLAKLKFGRSCWTSKGKIGFQYAGETKYVSTLEQYRSYISESVAAVNPVISTSLN